MRSRLPRQTLSASEVRAALRARITVRSNLLVGATVATGVAAQAMQAGGVDFLVATQAARMRVMGVHPLTAYLPLGDSNAAVADFGRKEFVSRVSTPVFFGASVLSPEVTLPELVAKIHDWGFAGVVNMPGAGVLGGRFRSALEDAGLGIKRERDFLAEARRQGLLTMAYAHSWDDALALGEAEPDMFCLTFGPDSGGLLGVSNSTEFQSFTSLARPAIDKLRGIYKHPLFLIDGGPVATPQEMVDVCDGSGADGYLGGSTIGRRPIELSVKDITTAYKAATSLVQARSSSEEQLWDVGRSVGLISQSPSMLPILRTISRVARTNLSILITGENGTGKELVAAAIHRHSKRASKDIVAVNCAALPRDLLESELFGYESGAFTGAARSRAGRFESADGSTLFLDEIGDLELSLQAKLLRALESGEFYRLGSNTARKVDVRIVCATNRDLEQMVEQGSFRQDLLYRLNAISIRIPPLRERLDDIPMLSRHFLERSRADLNPTIRGLDHSVYRSLLAHKWPGNVRELKHVLETALALCDDDVVDERHLPSLAPAPTQRKSIAEASMSFSNEKEWILAALVRNRFRREETARSLGISRKTLFNKMRQYGIDSG